MSNYIKTTNFAAKDSLPSGNAAKIVKGAEIDTEFNNIATASATKANANNAALTGTTVFATLSDGTIAITGWVDEDNMASNSAVLIPTQQSVKAYVDSNVTAQDLDVTDGTTSIDIDLDSESLGILGGTGVTSTASGTGVTLAIDSTVATLTGTQTLSNKTLTTPVISGALTTNSTIDGRDVAVDGTKLDGIESGATADQTAAEIKTAYESNANTNAFTDSDESKLDGIEASADVTDTTNVTAAGALMDSELTNITAVKALNQGVATGDSPTFAAVNAPLTGNVTGNLTGNVTGNVTGDLTGDVTGNVAGNLTGSVLTAAQTNITSVGALSSLEVSGLVRSNSLRVEGSTLLVTRIASGSDPSSVFTVLPSYKVGVRTGSPAVTLDLGSATDSVHMPVGTTAQRPTGAAGMFRYNSTLEQFEGYTDAWGAIGGGGGSNLVSDTMTGDGVDTTLTLSNDPLNENNTQVYIDGVYQNKDTYSVSGTTLTFSAAPPNGSAVEAMTIQPTAVNVPADASVTPAKIASGDFYFDTNTLYVDATNNRVGIGTGSPATNLHIQSTSEPAITLFHTGIMASQIGLDSTGSLTFGIDGSTGATERLRIAASGATTVTADTTSDWALAVSNGTNSNAFGLYVNAPSTSGIPLRIDGGGSERMRIDSAGKVNIGGVGNISPYGIRFAINGTGSGGAGLYFGSGVILPTDNTPTIADANVDLGASNYRFKDIYLSGGVNFSANANAAGMSSEVLDDYEEGSFTPSFTASTGNPTINYNTQTASYTKTGNVVTFTIMIVTNSRSGGSGQLSVAGLPFPVAAGQDYGVVIGFNFNWVSGENPQNAIAQGNTSHVLLYKDAKTNTATNPDDILSSGNSYLRLTGSYFTAS